MTAASFVQFTGSMAALAIVVAVLAWAGVARERRRATRVFEELTALRHARKERH